MIQLYKNRENVCIFATISKLLLTLYFSTMNKMILSCAMLIVSIAASAQSWSTGTSTLYANPTTTKVGIGISSPIERLHINSGALKIGNGTSATDRAQNLLKFGDNSYVQIGEWEANNTLSFKANNYNFTNGNVGIGVTSPQYKLDVNGKMYLHTVDWRDGMANSYLQWECHRLVMGVRDGFYAHTIVEIMPGGGSEGPVYSQLSMYNALNATNKVEKIRLWTAGNSWINNDAYFGLGTDAPLCKLDVRGTIRANEILVNTVSGADFVFDKDYKLRPLSEVKRFIQSNRHLPEIPTAKEMLEDGVSLDKLVIQLLQKVEELTLYTIQLEEKINELENQK